MTWRKHFQSSARSKAYQQLTAQYTNDQYSAPTPNTFASRFSSWLPEVYSGQPNRIERYSQYDQMNLDTEINMALDTIADSCVQKDEKTNLYFKFEWAEGVTEEDTEILKEMLKQWSNINRFDITLWRMFRSVLMYGDQFYIRDPETYELFWVDPSKVDGIVVNEGNGKEPEEYLVRDLDANHMTLVASGNLQDPPVISGYTNGPFNQTRMNGIGGYVGRPVASRFNKNPNSTAGMSYNVNADNVLHLSLSEGMDSVWPFGVSILENVFKTFKQKELIEDAVIIYRVQRAPERRVFYIDTGKLPSHRAMAYLERIKNEIQQKRIPSRTGGSENIMDATYNPQSMLEDFFFAQNSDGKGSRVDTLPGGEQLGQIDDLRYFNHKLRTGLRVPRSYMPDFDDGGGAVFNDGRVGTAYIEELRFTKYCQRLQNMIAYTLDREFKLFCKHRGINIQSNLYILNFVEPQNFSKYRQTEVDNAVVGVYQQVAQIKHLSRRFALKRFLGLSEDEILENERMWSEENKNKLKSTKGYGDVEGMGGGGNSSSFSDVGATPTGVELGGESGEEPLNTGEDTGAETPNTSGAASLNAQGGDASDLGPQGGL